MIHISDIIAIPEGSPHARAMLRSDSLELGVRIAWAQLIEDHASAQVIARIWRMQLEAAKPKQGRLL